MLVSPPCWDKTKQNEKGEKDRPYRTNNGQRTSNTWLFMCYVALVEIWLLSSLCTSSLDPFFLDAHVLSLNCPVCFDCNTHTITHVRICIFISPPSSTSAICCGFLVSLEMPRPFNNSTHIPPPAPPFFWGIVAHFTWLSVSVLGFWVESLCFIIAVSFFTFDRTGYPVCWGLKDIFRIFL